MSHGSKEKFVRTFRKVLCKRGVFSGISGFGVDVLASKRVVRPRGRSHNCLRVGTPVWGWRFMRRWEGGFCSLAARQI